MQTNDYLILKPFPCVTVQFIFPDNCLLPKELHVKACKRKKKGITMLCWKSMKPFIFYAVCFYMSRVILGLELYITAKILQHSSGYISLYYYLLLSVPYKSNRIYETIFNLGIIASSFSTSHYNKTEETENRIRFYR